MQLLGFEKDICWNIKCSGFSQESELIKNVGIYPSLCLSVHFVVLFSLILATCELPGVWSRNQGFLTISVWGEPMTLHICVLSLPFNHLVSYSSWLNNNFPSFSKVYNFYNKLVFCRICFWSGIYISLWFWGCLLKFLRQGCFKGVDLS